MSFGYHAFIDQSYKSALNACSRYSEEYPLIVNCTGNASFTFPFTTNNPSGREDFYLLYMVSGSMDVTLPHGTERIHGGQAAIFPPHYHYIYRYDGSAPMNYLWVHFTGSHAAKFLDDFGYGTLPCLKAPGNDPKISSLFSELYDCFEIHSPLSRPKSASVLEQLLLRIAEDSHERSEGMPPDASLRLIHEAYHTDLKIPELARMENLSHSRYVTVFRERTGMSPTAYIIAKRISAACELLETTDLPIRQISLLVGYEDPHFFSKIFKKNAGCSPKEYRSSKQKES